MCLVHAAITCMWWSEDNFSESVLFYHVDSAVTHGLAFICRALTLQQSCPGFLSTGATHMHCHAHQFYSFVSKVVAHVHMLGLMDSEVCRTCLFGNDLSLPPLGFRYSKAQIGCSYGFTGWPSKNGSPSPWLSPSLSLFLF